MNVQKSSYSTYPYGMQLPNRNQDGYRYGFQGMEADDEVKGDGNSYTTPLRQLDSRIARWLTTDPVVHHHQSPYVSHNNNPLTFVDPSGGEGQDWVKGKKTGEQWHFDEKVKDEASAILHYGEDASYGKIGTIYSGEYLGGSENVMLLENGNWKWSSNHLDETSGSLPEIYKRNNSAIEYFLGLKSQEYPDDYIGQDNPKYLYSKGAMACHSPAGSMYETMERQGWNFFGGQMLDLSLSVATGFAGELYFGARASVTLSLSDDAFVHVTPTKYANNILTNGLDPAFSGGKSFVTRWGSVKNVTNSSDFNKILYRQNLWKSTIGKFDDGATILQIKAKPSFYRTRTNWVNGVPQYIFDSPVSPKNINLIKSL